MKDLLDAGSGSLGGARPRASVRDGDRLFIAKFPHPGDDWDVIGWEKTAVDLAERSGIEVRAGNGPRSRADPSSYSSGSTGSRRNGSGT